MTDTPPAVPTTTRRETCRACGHGPLTDLFSLGDQVVSDFVLPSGITNGNSRVVEIRNISGRRIERGEFVYYGKEVEPLDPSPRVPIELVQCPACTLVQQRWTAPQDLLYRRHYWYRCIGAREKIFARVKNWGKYKDRDCLVHDTAERIFSSPHPVELPCVGLDGSVEWRPVLQREASIREVYEIEFFTGARVTASAEHRWPRVRSDMTWTGEKTTAELRPKMRVPVVMDMPRPDAAVDHGSIYDEDAGYLVGVFIAEGCIGQRGIRLAVHRTNDGPMVERLREYVTGRLYESFRTGKEIQNSKGMEVSIIGPVVQGIIKKFVAGKLSKGKRLATAAWSQPTAFLKGVLDGWLDGDAHQEPDSDRSRFNICKNTDLVEDIALACRIVGYTMRYRERKGSGLRGVGDTTQYCGWVRKSRVGMRQKNGLGRLMGTSVNRVWKKPQPKKVWDVAVGGSQLYALGCGIVTHNSGTTDTMRRALADVVDAAMSRVRLEPGDVVLDIGSNDGTLLRQYPESLKLKRIGVEPAENLATKENYADRGLNVYGGFWTYDGFSNWYNGNWAVKPYFSFAPVEPRAKIVTACGMLYDLEDPESFVRDVARVLAPDGLFVAQLQCLRQTVALKDVGNFCHEHLEFYTLKSLAKMFWQCGLAITDVEGNDVNGGSYRLYAQHRGPRMSSLLWGNVAEAEAAERDMGLYEVDRLISIGQWMKGLMANLYQTVESIVRAGKTVWVYGASTKGNVILQAAGIDHRLIKYAVDKSPEKVGRYTAGSGILIRSETDFRAAAPDFALVLPYTFIDEFTEREAAWRSGGGKWIVPIPEVRVV